MRKYFFIVFLFFLLIGYFYYSPLKCYKTSLSINDKVYLQTNSQIESELEDNIDDQLNDIDFGDLENLVDSLEEENKFIFSSQSFIDVVKNFISADENELFTSFIPFALNTLFSNLLNFLPYFAIIIAIAIIYSLMSGISNEKNKSVTTLINIVCFSSIAVIILNIIVELLKSSLHTIGLIEQIMEIIFPIILTFITAIGNVVTATTFQPLLVILSSGITKIFTVILIPIFIFSIIFGIVGNISKNVRLDKFSKFFSSLFKWIIGIVFTVFISFLTLQGLTVSTIDTISLKTAKFAIKSYVPILGSYLSDGMSLIISSSVLIKNAVGISGIVLLFSIIFVPIIKIVIIGLLLKLISAILEPVTDKEIPNFLYTISKSLNMLVVCIIAVGFMFLISVAILMCCANIF